MKQILLLYFTLFLSASGWAQSNEVIGKVTDETGFPLPGVSILKVGSSTGTVTDIDGSFSIKADTGERLQFSYLGFKSQTLTVENSTELTVVLREDVSNLDEVVVIGYGSASKRELTGATAQVQGDAIEKMNMPRVDQALQGKLAGVNISTNSGAPGGTSNIRIRGIGTFGDNDPLILVDGVIYDAAGLNALNPGDIESVNVLKDGTAGIYGVRAANGVILIETKKEI